MQIELQGVVIHLRQTEPSLNVLFFKKRYITHSLPLDESHLDAVKSSSERCCYVRLEQTDLLYANA